jgi:membrane dipeptidase
MHLIIDAHEDLAYNMIELGRDYTRPVAEIRSQDAVRAGGPHQESLLGWQEYQQGRVALVFGTLFAAPRRQRADKADPWKYSTPDQAHQLYRQQIDRYHRLVDDAPDQFRLIYHRADLASVLSEWDKPVVAPEDPDDHRPVGHPVGLVVLMEGADGIRTPDELPEWWDAGLRIIGLALRGTRYSGGTNEPGPLTSEGRELLEAMADIGFGLDLSHMDPPAALQAVERYPGPVIVSHANPLGMLKGRDSNRYLPDDLIDRIFERDGVIGAMPSNPFLLSGWTVADGKAAVSLDLFADHLDYLCQRAGDARHVGIGSDYDGGFGRESTPAEIDSIADLQKTAAVLAGRGYSDADIQAIFNGNWLRKLNEILPAA